MIYLDTSALVKLVRREAESAALAQWLNDRAAPLAASALVEVELPKALRRSAPGVLGGVAAVIARIHRIEINDAVRATAGAYPDPALRSLDAIHLATAELMVASGQPVDAFVAYDRRLADAATRLGLTVSAPG